jgi:hypothetical protein
MGYGKSAPARQGLFRGAPHFAQHPANTFPATRLAPHAHSVAAPRTPDPPAPRARPRQEQRAPGLGCRHHGHQIVPRGHREAIEQRPRATQMPGKHQMAEYSVANSRQPGPATGWGRLRSRVGTPPEGVGRPGGPGGRGVSTGWRRHREGVGRERYRVATAPEGVGTRPGGGGCGVPTGWGCRGEGVGMAAGPGPGRWGWGGEAGRTGWGRPRDRGATGHRWGEAAARRGRRVGWRGGLSRAGGSRYRR